MSTKLTKKEIATLKTDCGIKDVTTREEATEKMVEFLEANEIDDLDNVPFEELVSMTEVMYEGSDDESEDLADEVEEEDQEEEEEDQEDETEEEDEDLEDEEKEEEEEDNEPKTKVKSKTKAKTESKTETKEKTKSSPKRKNRKLDPKNNPEDAKKFDKLISTIKDQFSDHNFEFNFIANGGLTVKFLGENSKRAFFSFDSPKNKDGVISARVYFPTIKDEQKIRDLFDNQYEVKPDWSDNILVRDIGLTELVEFFEEKSDELQTLLKNFGAKDSKLGKNRDKMEEELKKGKVEKAKSIKSKKSEEDTEEKTPKKKAAPKKKTTNKKASSTKTKKTTKKKSSK